MATTTPAPPITRRELRTRRAREARPAFPKWHFPAVDGLRGIAILSVLFYHAGITSRGLFGVDVFFAVSGFLTTFILLREIGRSGRINLKRFYVRRVKRLLPPLLITIAIVLGAAYFLGTRQDLTHAADKAFWAILNVANLEQIVSGGSYWDFGANIQPLAHMWSLSVTEQFYIVWPLLLVGICWIGRRSTAVLAVSLTVLTVAAALVAPLLFDGTNMDRLYLGTDARAVTFIAGSASAAIVYWTAQHRRRRATAAQAPTALRRILVTGLSTLSLLAIIGASIAASSYTEAWLYQGGIAGVAIAASVLMATLTSEANALNRFFSLGMFRLIGQASYSIYLVHLPIFWLLQILTPAINAWTLFFVGAVLSWVLGAFLHYGIGEPIRLSTWRTRTRMPAFLGSLTAIAATALVFSSIQIGPAASPATAAQRSIEGHQTVLTLGDSLAIDMAASLEGRDEYTVINGGHGGCGLLDSEKTRATSGYEWALNCPDPSATWPAKIAETQPDVIVLHSSWDAADQYRGGRWMKPGDAEYRAQYTKALDEFMGWAADHAPRARVLISNDRLTNGILTDPKNMTAYNELVTDYAESHEAAALLDLRSALCDDRGRCSNTDDQGRVIYQSDNVHFTKSGQAMLGDWLEKALRVA